MMNGNEIGGGVPPEVWRLAVFVFGSVGIMSVCGWISWCAGPLENRWRFYGGLFGGLAACGLLFYLLLWDEIWQRAA